MKLTIDMPWEKDLSVNHMRYGKGGGYRKKRHVQEWMEWCHWCVRTAWNSYRDDGYPGRWPFSIPVYVTVDFRFPDNRKRDDHNLYKVICDAVASGLMIDDKDIRISTGSVTVDKANAGFTITVEDRQ